MDYNDALAAIGAGSAHPGSFSSTVLWADKVQLGPSCRVLDVGCGTGRTLIYLKQRFGCEIAGVDIRPQMIKKARRRATLSGVTGTWKVAPAQRLPFADESFDLVVTESVNVFLDPHRELPQALREYLRVLTPGGQYVDVEMMVARPVTPEWRESVKSVYGAVFVPDQAGWKQVYTETGFSSIEVLANQSVQLQNVMSDTYPDEVDLSSRDAFRDPRVFQVMMANTSWMEGHHQPLSYGIFLCEKARHHDG